MARYNEGKALQHSHRAGPGKALGPGDVLRGGSCASNHAKLQHGSTRNPLPKCVPFHNPQLSCPAILSCTFKSAKQSRARNQAIKQRTRQHKGEAEVFDGRPVHEQWS